MTYYGQGTPIVDTSKEFQKEWIRREGEKSEKQKCIEKGGDWDPITNTCILIPKEPKQPEPERKKVEQQGVETFTDPRTGRGSGVTIPDGKGGTRTFLGLNPEEIQTIATGEQQKLARPEGTAPVGTEQASFEQQQLLQQQAKQIGAIPLNFAPAQQAPIDWGQAVTTGVVGAAPSILGSAAAGFAAGAVGGTAVTPGVGTAIGAGIGAVVGVWRGVSQSIKSQQRGEIGASQDVLSAARTNMRQLAMLAGQDPANAGEYIQAYNAQLTQVHQAYRQIKAETQGNLNKFMEDGTDILSDFELFLAPNGTAEIYGNKLGAALFRNTPIPLTEADISG